MDFDSFVSAGLLGAIVYLAAMVTQHGPKLEKNTEAQNRNSEAQDRNTEAQNNVAHVLMTSGARPVQGFRTPTPKSMVATSVPKK